MARRAEDLQLVLHIGLHKTASTYVQNVLSARRYDLIQDGVLYPSTGTVDDARTRTRDGAQSGHFPWSYRRRSRTLMPSLLEEMPVNVHTVLLSAEDFSHPRATAEEQLSKFLAFGSIKVVAVVRRQDAWIESYYKQIIDQYADFETRSFADFLLQDGPSLLDFHARLSPWRELVGPENFFALSYDDLSGGDEILRRILRIAGVPEASVADYPGMEVPRYDSIRAIDTLGLRILNGFRLPDRDVRNKIAREIYETAPPGDVRLLTPEMRAGIQTRYAEINERIEAEWFTSPVPGFRFGSEPRAAAADEPSSDDILEYVERVVALAGSGHEICDAAAAALEAEAAEGLDEAAATDEASDPAAESAERVAGVRSDRKGIAE